WESLLSGSLIPCIIGFQVASQAHSLGMNARHCHTKQLPETMFRRIRSRVSAERANVLLH
ncbi:MAG: hypothetical protein E6959_11470, partial [Eikenella corrodens]|nr:hypothetical protein [Eikenella corrodens]